ncbi:trypsin-like serine peptidase [Acuticoccus kandeliae]|uniref:trypsin-like serine peptidase n=1 Tax=Acuticoccus kandeliae TaxID=2073160 RepID=UPI000D3E6884|nr:serine protease [Acuticoccus kandeliae]
MTVTAVSRAICLAALCALATPSAAADPNLAIGRANHASYDRTRHCTMFAVGPRVAITAEHCLYKIDPAALQLLFGYDRMEWALHESPDRFAEIARDVVALCLPKDAPATLPGPSKPVAEGDTVSVVGYARRRPHVQTVTSCKITAQDPEFLLLDCPLDPGTSGGPVLNAAGEAVGVISMSAPETSIAARLPEGAAAACR